ncbi:MAG: efflux RND transporter permease subunit [Deltaproteobacteria bacterium]|nr:efflux RND transporter permease subunit [Deltaproteobacteria bacterium]
MSLPVRRPVATSMVFAAIVLLGIVGWEKIPIELLPDLEGDQLHVSFMRPNSEPEVVEREILLPLEARASELSGMAESWGEVRGSRGSFRVRFEPDSDIKVRQLELQRLAVELTRVQPQGTMISVDTQDLSSISRFVMIIQVIGGDDTNALRSLVDDRIQPRLSAITGVDTVWVAGGAPEEVTVKIDPNRCAALGISPSSVGTSLSRSVQRLRFLGGLEDEESRTAVMLDGRPRGAQAIAETRIELDKPVLIRHVAAVERGTGQRDMLFRVNSKPSVGLIVFKEEGANLVKLGQELRARLKSLRDEFRSYGVEFLIGFDGAEYVEKLIDRLKQLALSGFLIALVVLFLFIRQARAVCVVAVAVPVSLLAALAMLFVGSYSLNLITLFGLAVGIGMLVDNSIVVYEAVQRRLERGVSPDEAAAQGVGLTVRAIVAATATTAVVFLPVAFLTEDVMMRGMLRILAVAILLPLISSLLVAVGLVPLLARHLAAPAALSRLKVMRDRRKLYAGQVPPDRGRELFSGLLKVALRRPAAWLTVVIAAVLFTVIVAIPWVGVNTVSQEAEEADQIRLSVDVPSGKSLEAIGKDFVALEQAALDLKGVEYVESVIQEGNASLTVHLVDPDERPEDISARRVRAKVREAAETQKGLDIRSEQTSGDNSSDGGGEAALFGQGPAEIVLSGPDAGQLMELAKAIKERLESIPEVGSAWISAKEGQDEIQIVPDHFMLNSLGLTPSDVLPMLSMLGREGTTMQTGLILADGREIPVKIRTPEIRYTNISREMDHLRLHTQAGIIPLGLVADTHKMPPPPMIQHHNGRRELSVYYRFNDQVPETGPARKALDENIRNMMREVHRPTGYTIDSPDEEESTGWFRRLLVPMILMLFAVLAITFESLTLPVLVLFALPLTILGATWALVLAGMPAGPMALAGCVALLGLTVNPAILLVDRMQQRVLRSSWTAGAAALAAVRERTRPILMTTCTTVAGLWPLALATGRENEIWPPFAVVVMGGLATSSLLTLLVTPVGFVFLNRLDRIFGRLGPWVVLAWLGATTAVMTPLFVLDQITSMTWQITTTVLVAALFLGVGVFVFRRPELPEPDLDEGPPLVEARYLRKVYGRPGPIGRALRMGQDFGERVLALGGKPFLPRDARQNVITLVVFLAGIGYLAFSLNTMWWRLIFSFTGSVIAGRLLIQLRRLRGKCDPIGRVTPGGIEHILSVLVPWIIFAMLGWTYTLLPWMEARNMRLPWPALVLVGVIIVWTQLGRRTAKQLSAGVIPERMDRGFLRRSRTLWRKMCRRIFGLDLPREEVEALRNIHFTTRSGMMGILGPNGAGKTTLLRMLAGILEPSLGTIHLGGVDIKHIRRHLARWVGYLPQDFGLPEDLTGCEYLEYYALLYDIGTDSERKERVERLLKEVGLSEQADRKIGGYSGGMRQRVAVARTLLRLPAVIIVDEPTVGLDPRERIRFRNLLAELAKTRVVLFSTHVVEDVAVACDRVIVLARGEKVFDGEPSLLTREAKGRVWEMRIGPGEEGSLPEDAMVVDQVPEEDGSTLARVLCPRSPGAQAHAVSPNLQDGYLQLVGLRRE